MVKISVIIPFFNSEEYIKNTLRSVSSQSIADIEIICVDDGSTDGSAEIVHEMSAKDSRIKYIKQENAGAGVARNNGIKFAEGRYVAFMDSDDEYPENGVLELLFRKAEESDALICGGNICKENKSLFSETKHGEGFVDFRESQNIYWFTRNIYRRDFLIEQICYFPPYRVYEDPVFLLKAISAAGKYYYVTKETYRVLSSHTSSTLSQRQIKDYLCGILDIISISLKENYTEVFNAALNTLRSHFYMESLKCIHEGRADCEFFEKLISLNCFLGQVEGMRIQNEYVFFKTGNSLKYLVGKIRILTFRAIRKIFVTLPKSLFGSLEKPGG